MRRKKIPMSRDDTSIKTNRNKGHAGSPQVTGENREEINMAL